MFKALIFGICFAGLLFGQARPLDIYWVDVEGGAATLMVTPSGESFLVDAGNPGDRDARRIFDVATKQAGLKKIDYLFITHFHGDHVGGVPALAKLITIGHFYDHGESVEQGRGASAWDAYRPLAEGRRSVVKAGDMLPLKGMKVEVVAAAGKVLAKPLPGGGPNALCGAAQQKPADMSENGQSAGILLTYGKFKFLDLGDLTWDREMELACPDNKIGTVTLVQATHHGFFHDFSGAPALYNALKPEVVVVNNGARKGLQPSAYELISGIPGLEAVWQVHLAVDSDKAHNTAEQRIANNEPEDQGHWLKASVAKDGSFTIANSRNEFSEKYKSR
ncbi:MAG: MBL fold metallo-hydrolase [Acidobacteriota bacterium]